MIYTAEAVLPGHPDKFCDQIAERIVLDILEFEPRAYAQIEVSVWSDEIWINGAVCTKKFYRRNFEELVYEVGTCIGYTPDNHIDVRKYKIRDSVCRIVKKDPTLWSRYVNDQSIVIGWAGYDEKTHYLRPEQFAVHFFREEVFNSCLNGYMKGYGPDGKILVVIEDKKTKFSIEAILVTVMHPANIKFEKVIANTIKTLESAYAKLKEKDERWDKKWEEIKIYINPNGPLINGGSNSDNGQTGRKLVMDYYGPAVPIGGGALSGKIIGHIDRLAAYASRDAAVSAVKAGAKECLVRLSYSPLIPEPLDVNYVISGKSIKKIKKTREFFNYYRMIERYNLKKVSFRIAQGNHFYDLNLKWNKGECYENLK